jgi:uncharacterized membrane-anchored protein YitT (DUF2179 family)
MHVSAIIGSFSGVTLTIVAIVSAFVGGAVFSWLFRNANPQKAAAINSKL